MKASELMKACGSKSGKFEPESIEQWRWSLANGDGPERALAWVRLKSVANGSPCCVGDDGRPLTIDSMAADLGWSLSTAKNVSYALAEQGRIRTSKGRLFYRADVPQGVSNRSGDEEGKNSVHSFFPTYLLDLIRGLPSDRRDMFEALSVEYHAWRPKLFADALAAARAIDERVQDSILLQVGVKRKKLPKRRPVESKFVQVSLFAAPDFVQSANGDLAALSVQTANGGSYTPENGSVQSGASLFTPDPDQDSRGVPAAAIVPAPVERAAAAPADVVNRCAELGLSIPGERFAQKLLARFSALPPANWPKFPGQRSAGLWLSKSHKEMAAEFFRQHNTPEPQSKKATAHDEAMDAYRRQYERAKGAAS